MGNNFNNKNNRDLVSKEIRDAFRVAMAQWLHVDDISKAFSECKGFRLTDKDLHVACAPNMYTITEQGEHLIDQHYAKIDFSLPADIKNFLLVCDNVIYKLNGGADKPLVHRCVRDQIHCQTENLKRMMEQDGYCFEKGRFVMPVLDVAVVDTSSLVRLGEDSINEHIGKARQKIASGDYSGAITSANTLIERVLKYLAEKLGVPRDKYQNKGDLRDLYSLIAGPLNLEPAGEDIEKYQKPVLGALIKLIAGLYDFANKAGDRHDRICDPAERHANLALNAASSACGFLLDSYQSQQQPVATKKLEKL